MFLFSGIRDLVSLQYLDISSNQISHLPESIGELSVLKKLHVSNNRLKKIPQSKYQYTLFYELNKVHIYSVCLFSVIHKVFQTNVSHLFSMPAPSFLFILPALIQVHHLFSVPMTQFLSMSYQFPFIQYAPHKFYIHSIMQWMNSLKYQYMENSFSHCLCWNSILADPSMGKCVCSGLVAFTITENCLISLLLDARFQLSNVK